MLVLLLPTVGYAKCCDCCVEKYFMYTPINATTTIFGEAINSKSLNDTGIKKLIGKMVHRTKPIKAECRNDDSFMCDPLKLLTVSEESLTLISEYNKLHELKRDIWDDGNWEEVKPQRLTVREAGGEISYTLLKATSTKYSCVRCGRRLDYSFGDVNYYCTSCKTGFNIKAE